MPKAKRLLRQPPLFQGQILDAEQFHELYHRMPGVKKVELIQGVVHMPSPVSPDHDSNHFNFILFIGAYQMATHGIKGHLGVSYRPNQANEFQADGMMYILPECGGKARYFSTRTRRRTTDKYLTGVPELALEVAKTSQKRDLKKKFKVYQGVGIPEYLVHDIPASRIHWWHLVDGVYQPLPVVDNVIRSLALPGLWFDTNAFLRGDMPAVFQTLNLGLASPEHAAFVERLAKARELLALPVPPG